MKLSEAQERYRGTTGGYFSLQNDKDKAVVRFLYDFAPIPADEVDLETIDCYVVHEISVDGKTRPRMCTTKSDCPDCATGNKPRLRMFIQLLDLRDNQVKIWERASSYAGKLLGFTQRYGPLCNRPYEIERRGAKGSADTKYEIYPLDKDDKKLEDFPDRANIMGTMLLMPGEEPRRSQESKATIERATVRRETISNRDVF